MKRIFIYIALEKREIMVYRGHLQTDDPRDAPRLVRMAPLRSSRSEPHHHHHHQSEKSLQSPGRLSNNNQSSHHQLSTKISPPKLRNINEIRATVQTTSISMHSTKSRNTVKSPIRSQNSLLANLQDLERLRNMPSQPEIKKPILQNDMGRTTRMLAQKILKASRFDTGNKDKSSVIDKTRQDEVDNSGEKKLLHEENKVIGIVEEEKNNIIIQKNNDDCDTTPRAPIRRRKNSRIDSDCMKISSVNVDKTFGGSGGGDDDKEKKIYNYIHRPDILDGLLKESDRQLEQLRSDLGGKLTTQEVDSDTEEHNKKGQLLNYIIILIITIIITIFFSNFFNRENLKP